MKYRLLFVAMLMAAGVLHAQTTDTVRQSMLDSIDAKMKMVKLKEISVSAPKPVYSMTGEVVNYNVENDETVRDLTAWDAIRNAPTVQIDEEGNLTMRGSRFFTFDPSLSLTHRTEGMHYWRFRLSHNVNTPTGGELTTSRTYSDDSYSTGNRSLRSSYTGKATVSWNKYFQKMGNMGVEAYANYTRGTSMPNCGQRCPSWSTLTPTSAMAHLLLAYTHRSSGLSA